VKSDREPYDDKRNNSADRGNRQDGYYASAHDAAARLYRVNFLSHGFSFWLQYGAQLAGASVQRSFAALMTSACSRKTPAGPTAGSFMRQAFDLLQAHQF
jgi:hypothetical protein